MPNDLPQLPPLDAHGLLPPGVYDCLLEDVERLFGQFQRSDRRLRLFAHLREYIDQLQKAEIKAQVIIDGSFVMGCVDEPEDIDVILVLPPEWSLQGELKPFEYNLVGRKRVRVRFGFDVLPVDAGTDAERERIAFFQQTNPKWRRQLNLPLAERKGLLRITP